MLGERALGLHGCALGGAAGKWQWAEVLSFGLKGFKTFLWCFKPCCGVENLVMVFKTLLSCLKHFSLVYNLLLMFKTFLWYLKPCSSVENFVLVFKTLLSCLKPS